MPDYQNQEDVNGEKLTVKKWWIFGADFSRFTQSFSWFIRNINGEKKISLLMIFFTVSFSRFTPSRQKGEMGRKRAFVSQGFWTFRGPFASHDSHPYPNRNRIAR